jgi:hypothetical protein
VQLLNVDKHASFVHDVFNTVLVDLDAKESNNAG